MDSRRVSASWMPGPLRCEVVAGPFGIAVDEPESVGGTGTAPEPTSLLLASVASCFTLAFVHSAALRAIPLNGLRVEVVGDYAGRRFAAMHVSVDAAGPTPEEVDSLLEAAARVCYVTNTLRAGVAVEIVSSSFEE